MPSKTKLRFVSTLLALALVAIAACSGEAKPPASGVADDGDTGAVGTTASSPTTATTTTGTAGATTGGSSTTTDSSTTTAVTTTVGAAGSTSSSTTSDSGTTAAGMGGSGGAIASMGGSGGSGATGNTTGTTMGSTTGGASEPCEAAGSLSTGDSLHSLTVGGNEYPFNVHVPSSYDGTTRMPVVFDFHGLGGDENQMQRLSGWAAKGDEAGFITVFPGGVDNAWNAGGCCSDTPTDVDFVREAISYLDSEACIDTKRIYASGCSNGGAMSYRLACEAADVIAAVAPVDFDCVVGGGCGSCNPSRPITEIQFRGTDDSAVPYSGAEPNFENWGEINQCSGSPEALPENASCQRHPMCADGVESILCTVQNGSHCGSYSSFGIADLGWEIISRYSLP